MFAEEDSASFSTCPLPYNKGRDIVAAAGLERHLDTGEISEALRVHQHDAHINPLPAQAIEGRHPVGTCGWE